MSPWLALNLWFDPAPFSGRGSTDTVYPVSPRNLPPGGSQHTICWDSLLSLPEDHKPSFQVLAKTVKLKVLSGSLRGSVQTRDPLEWGQPVVIMTSMCPVIRFLPGPLKHLSPSCRKKLLGQMTCLQPMSLGAHKAEINE